MSRVQWDFLPHFRCATREKISENSKLNNPSYIPAYAYEFQLLTAMRRGEVCPLLKSDVDREKQTLYIHQELIPDRENNRKLVINDYTKTETDRDYALAMLEETFLEKYQKVLEKYYPKSKYLFPGGTSLGCISIEVVYSFHKRLCNKLNIEVNKEIRKGPHSFRRNRITEVVNCTDGNAVLAAQMYGNSPKTIQKNYYTGDSLERQREALNKRKVI